MRFWYLLHEGLRKPPVLTYPVGQGPEVIKLEFILKLKIKHNDWLLEDMYQQAANHSALFWVWDCTQVL